MLKEWCRIENRKMEQIIGIFVMENKSRHTTKNNDYKEKYKDKHSYFAEMAGLNNDEKIS